MSSCVTSFKNKPEIHIERGKTVAFILFSSIPMLLVCEQIFELMSVYKANQMIYDVIRFSATIVNFINVFCKALACVDPKIVKRYWRT